MRFINEEDHLPVEIFGYVPEDISEAAERHRINKICPFTNEECIKKLTIRRESEPSGHCTVSHLGNPHVICPQRFYEDNFRLLKEARNLLLGSEGTFKLLHEVGLPENRGRVDWIILKLQDFGSIEDFIGLEIQADQTTYTGKLTQALVEYQEKGTFSKNYYGYGLNTKNQIKTSLLSQNFDEAPLFESWNKKLVWILQDIMFDNFTERYNYNFKQNDLSNSIVFLAYKLEFSDKTKRYHFKQTIKTSTNIQTILDTKKIKVPSVYDFIPKLQRKVKESIDLS